MEYDKKDVPQFQEDVCKKTCIMKGKCVEENKDTHWFLMCPHYHSWKLGYTSFIWEQIQWEREHPEEIKKKKEQNKELAKQIRESKKTKKAVTDE
jgi:hypothetical protein